MRFLIIILGIQLSLVSCNDKLATYDEEKDVYPKQVEFALIGKGGNARGITKSNIVIKDTYTWTKLINQIKGFNISHVLEEVDIDFDKYQIIAVFDEVRSYGGYSIDIISVVENESNITVSIGNLQNGSDAPVITQPYDIGN